MYFKVSPSGFIQLFVQRIQNKIPLIHMYQTSSIIRNNPI
jgi:hypothetical protein